jgi:cobaltochelatase CobT
LHHPVADGIGRLIFDWLNKLLFPSPVARPQGYHIWSATHDEVVDAKELLKQYYQQPANDPPDPSPREVLHAYEAATVDLRASLANEIFQTSESITRQWSTEPTRPIVASLLMDHSGSLKGEPIKLMLSVAESFAAICDALDIKHEILAFTTVNWHGKPLRQEWIRRGSMMYPGRLCALRHIVYRRFSASDKKLDLSAMFIPDLLKENVDGEAILWAVERMAHYVDHRRILFVVSDGAPVDDSTLQENATDILWKHLHEVIRQLLTDGRVELCGIGIINPTNNLYPCNCRVTELEDVEQNFLPFLSKIMLNQS